MASPELTSYFDEMARNRAGGVVSLQLAWSAALNKLASLKMREDFVRATANVCMAPRDVDLVTSLLASGSGGENLLAETFQASAYSQEDILDGVITLCRELDRDRRQTDLEMVFGYIRCCEDGADDYPSASSLKEVVEQMLQEHGFTGGA